MFDALLAVDGGIVFWLLTIVTIVSGLMVVSLKNIFHCALALIACLSAVAGIYILLNAEFLAAAQVLIYVGAVAILLIFAVMLTNKLASQNIKQTNENSLIAGCICFLFAISVYLIIDSNEMWYRFAREELPSDNIMAIGKLLMTQFMLPFEVVSILLVAAMIGAIALARQEKA